MQFLQSHPASSFTGKGGVGKTSIACAAAVQTGRREQARPIGQH
ncbi:ArsA-related P-loop ATPase [Pseudomonas aeruginosa]|nr:ArsA-related P-loop ATPase [Pseudomonas aeruginosa]